MNNQFCISIHSLRMEGDAARTENCGDAGHFNPLPPHGGRQSKVSDWVEHFCISIHSLRMEGDNCFSVLFQRLVAFQSTPSAWRETFAWGGAHGALLFQSTPSAWRETTGDRIAKPSYAIFQSTPSAWRETAYFSRNIFASMIISIHSLRMEGDPVLVYPLHVQFYFNPLPPHGGRLNFFQGAKRNIFISIHSLRMEGDSRSGDFQIAAFVFQSTPSAWRETLLFSAFPTPCSISIHSLRMEGDDLVKKHLFQGHISIHSLRMEGDKPDSQRWQCYVAFQSTPSAWRETTGVFQQIQFIIISIHSLRMEGDGSKNAAMSSL